MRERYLFVHAHPDDETISTGGFIATLVQAGAHVAVLTCTRGEQGEVIPLELLHLEGDGPALAAYRGGELARALGALGVTDHRYLGAEGARAPGLEPRLYEDSGMSWGPDGRAAPATNVGAYAFCTAAFDAVAADLRAVVDAVSPDVIVSYDAGGGYGHPDHVRAHSASRAVAAEAGVPFYAIVDPKDDPHEDDLVVDVSPVLPKVVEALRAHRTQVTLADNAAAGPIFALSSGPPRPVAATESYRLLATESVPVSPLEQEARGKRATAPAPGAKGESTVASVVFASIVGGLVGLLLTVNHQQQLAVAGAQLPIGIFLSLLIVAALLLGLRLVFASRSMALGAAVGVVVVATIASQSGPGGSVLVPANTAGFFWAYGPVVIALLVLAWPKLTQHHRG